MKLLFYDDFKLGVMNGNTVVDATSAVSRITHTSPQDLLNKLIEDFPNYRGSLVVFGRSSARLREQVHPHAYLPER